MQTAQTLKPLFILLLLSFHLTLALSQNRALSNRTSVYLEDSTDLILLSKKKWLWMSEKNIDSLRSLFHEKSAFIHMGGSWGKEPELDIIKSGGIWYKNAEIHDVSVNIIDNTAILLNKITLLAVVGGNEVQNPFMVTEVYIKSGASWSLGSLSFTKLLSP